MKIFNLGVMQFSRKNVMLLSGLIMGVSATTSVDGKQRSIRGIESSYPDIQLYHTLIDKISDDNLVILLSKDYLNKINRDLGNSSDSQFKIFERPFNTERPKEHFDSIVIKRVEDIINNNKTNQDKHYKEFEALSKVLNKYSYTYELRYVALDSAIYNFVLLAESIFGADALKRDLDPHSSNTDYDLAISSFQTILNTITDLKNLTSEDKGKKYLRLNDLIAHCDKIRNIGNYVFQFITTRAAINAIGISRVNKLTSYFYLIVNGFNVVKSLFADNIDFEAFNKQFIAYNKQRIISLIKPLILEEDNVFSVIEAEKSEEDKIGYIRSFTNKAKGVFKKRPDSKYMYSLASTTPISDDVIADIGLNMSTHMNLNHNIPKQVPTNPLVTSDQLASTILSKSDDNEEVSASSIKSKPSAIGKPGKSSASGKLGLLILSLLFTALVVGGIYIALRHFELLPK